MRALTLVILCSVSCAEAPPPRGQLVIIIDTDALLPPDIASATPTGKPIFDTMRVDGYEPNSVEPCTGCSRTFSVTQDQMTKGAVSFGMTARPGATGYRVRVRLYPKRASLTGDVPVSIGEQPPQSVIDVTAALPAVAEDGIVTRTLELSTEDVGTPRGTLASPVDTLAGGLSKSKAGTWPGAVRVPCGGEPSDDEVCIPGGAFWMGNPRVAGTVNDDDSSRLRLVVLSPFFLDATEVTVRRLREAGFGSQVLSWTGDSSGASEYDLCTFSPVPGARDKLPVNCITRNTALAFCMKRGADLPTEAQLEYVASAFEGKLWVWGDDPPSCGDAVYGRAGWGFFNSLVAPCKAAMPPGGPLPVGSGARDRIEVENGVVLDLVANVSEWTADLWNNQNEPCLSHGGVYRDPRCQTKSTAHPSGFVARGGSWQSTGFHSTAALRHRIDGNMTVGDPSVGFRCARPAN